MSSEAQIGFGLLANDRLTVIMLVIVKEVGRDRLILLLSFLGVTFTNTACCMHNKSVHNATARS